MLCFWFSKTPQIHLYLATNEQTHFFFFFNCSVVWDNSWHKSVSIILVDRGIQVRKLTMVMIILRILCLWDSSDLRKSLTCTCTCIPSGFHKKKVNKLAVVTVIKSCAVLSVLVTLVFTFLSYFSVVLCLTFLARSLQFSKSIWHT